MTKKNIFMIGICGIAMGTLAQMLAAEGHSVAGSDENIYPPMDGILARSGIKLFNRFDAGNIGTPDVVIVGNAISRGNVEVEHLLNSGISYLSMSSAIHEFFLEGKVVIAIAGTHGKSTTTALLAHILYCAGLSPSFFIGAVSRNFDSNFGLGSGKYFVIEGDEYDSAFFEKVPKFIFYRPHHLVMTSLEFDHADIYKDLSEIEVWFKRLVNIIPSNGNVVYSSDYKILSDVVEKSFSNKFSFGNAGDFEYSIIDKTRSHVRLDIRSSRYGNFSVDSRLFGEFNYRNILAGAAIALLLGVDKEMVRSGIATFEGVRRRQEIIFEKDNVVVVEDFAHHPTAINFFLKSLRERFEGYRIWALYEPRSATSRRNVFQNELPAAFKHADEILIKKPYRLEAVKNDERLNIEKLKSDLSSFNDNVDIFDNVKSMVDRISQKIDKDEKNIIAVMSNGGFDGIYDIIKESLNRILK